MSEEFNRIRPEVRVCDEFYLRLGKLTGYYTIDDSIYPVVKWDNASKEKAVLEDIYVLNDQFNIAPKKENQLYMYINVNERWKYPLIGFYFGLIGTLTVVEDSKGTCKASFHISNGRTMKFMMGKDDLYPKELMPIIPFKEYIDMINHKDTTKKEETTDYTKILNKNTAYFVQTNQSPYVFLSINGWCIPVNGNSGPCRLNPLFVDNKAVRIYEFLDYMENGNKAEPVWEKKQENTKLKELEAKKSRLMAALKELEAEMEKESNGAH